MTEEAKDPVPGTMEKCTLRDIEKLGDLDTGMRGSLAQLALILARRLDSLPADAAPTTVARLSQEYRGTLDRLMGRGPDDTSTLAEVFRILRGGSPNAR